MRFLLLSLTFNLLCVGQILAADRPGSSDYEPNAEYPFGRPNPAAPPQLAQFAFIIGENDCSDERLNNATGEWDSSERTWDAHYFMNGYGIRDSGGSGNANNGNIRIFDTASNEWQVTFFSMPVFATGIWRGGMEGDEIVLRQAQKAPGTDFDGFSTLTFSGITDTSFDWEGKWVSVDGSVEFPFWRISCQKRS